jgi:hypothetical protein
LRFEPAVISLLFTLLSVTLLLRRQESAIFVAPIFLCAALAFAAYAIVLLTPPIRALAESYGSIYNVDGYVRYRSQRRYPDEPPTYYVAVLDAEQHELGEWPLRERPAALDRGDLWPAVVEFAPYGGIHRIDGRSTGVLPDEFPGTGYRCVGHVRRRLAQEIRTCRTIPARSYGWRSALVKVFGSVAAAEVSPLRRADDDRSPLR